MLVLDGIANIRSMDELQPMQWQAKEAGVIVYVIRAGNHEEYENTILEADLAASRQAHAADITNLLADTDTAVTALAARR